MGVREKSERGPLALGDDRRSHRDSRSRRRSDRDRRNDEERYKSAKSSSRTRSKSSTANDNRGGVDEFGRRIPTTEEKKHVQRQKSKRKHEKSGSRKDDSRKRHRTHKSMIEVEHKKNDVPEMEYSQESLTLTEQQTTIDSSAALLVERQSVNVESLLVQSEAAVDPQVLEDNQQVAMVTPTTSPPNNIMDVNTTQTYDEHLQPEYSDVKTDASNDNREPADETVPPRPFTAFKLRSGVTGIRKNDVFAAVASLGQSIGNGSAENCLGDETKTEASTSRRERGHSHNEDRERYEPEHDNKQSRRSKHKKSKKERKHRHGERDSSRHNHSDQRRIHESRGGQQHTSRKDSSPTTTQGPTHADRHTQTTRADSLELHHTPCTVIQQPCTTTLSKLDANLQEVHSEAIAQTRTPSVSDLDSSGALNNQDANYCEKEPDLISSLVDNVVDVVDEDIPTPPARFGAEWLASPTDCESSVDDIELMSHTNNQGGSVVVLDSGTFAERIRMREDAEHGRMEGADVVEETDMFADDFTEKLDPTGGPTVLHNVTAEDVCDDSEGYHIFRAGEVIGGRYAVFSLAGKGVFSTAVRARDITRAAGNNEVVVKVIRRNDMMTRVAIHEEQVLGELAQQDVRGRGHYVKLHHAFDYMGHRCLVLDAYSCSLRKVIKNLWGTGLSLAAVRIYARQLLLALRFLGKCGLVHADIKPDNMLTKDNSATLVLSDFGSAIQLSTNNEEIAPYMVSRYYRAPEVILGRPFGCAIDMWAVGCVLFELYTGSYLFPGRTNNDMLKLQMECLGPIPRRLLRTAKFTSEHFDTDFVFRHQEISTLLQQKLERRLSITQATRPLRSRLLQAAEGTSEAHCGEQLEQLVDLLQQMLHLDGDRRITVKTALSHPFILAQTQPNS